MANAEAPEGSTIATAMRVHAFGGPEAMQLEQVELPPPGDGEILVRVGAAGVGPWDVWVRSGKSVLPQPLPLTPGTDIAGIVEKVGTGVAHLAIGDEVYGATNARFTNGYATHAICTAAMIAHKPASLSVVEASSVPVVAATAWQMLFDHAGVTRGDRVLVLGAAGAVGAYAVQLGVGAEMHMIASARGDDTGYLNAIGANEIMGPLDAPDRVPAGSMDAVLDLVGGDAQRHALRALKPGKTLVSAVSEPDQKACADLGVSGAFILVDVTSRALQVLADQFDRGSLRTNVGTVLPLSEARTAHQMMEGILPRPAGKIVLLN
jgi:NADPH:quinone reductase-like Zn-dependent oxidoreductase